MSILSENIRYLRGKLNLSQQRVADDLLITRGRYGKYEDGATEPPLDILVRISKYYNVSIDLLVTINVSKYSIDEIMELPDNRIVLPIRVDSNGNDEIEIIPQKASMGYLNGYGDPEYIESLDTISLPFLKGGKFRAFPAEGDSMPPYNDRTFIVGKYIESRNDLKIGKTYLFITREGMTYKRYADQNEYGTVVNADNSFYNSYEIEWSDVLEIWEYECSINRDDLGLWNNSQPDVQAMFLSLKNDIQILKNQIENR